jgi:hypothetical protein
VKADLFVIGVRKSDGFCICLPDVQYICIIVAHQINPEQSENACSENPTHNKNQVNNTQDNS